MHTSLKFHWFLLLFLLFSVDEYAQKNLKEHPRLTSAFLPKIINSHHTSTWIWKFLIPVAVILSRNNSYWVLLATEAFLLVYVFYYILMIFFTICFSITINVQYCYIQSLFWNSVNIVIWTCQINFDSKAFVESRT